MNHRTPNLPYGVIGSVKRLKLGKETRVGGVTEAMDKSIGRPILVMKGPVSANNYVDYEQISLTGRYLSVQLKVEQGSVATFHLEVVSTKDVTIRITVSTLYDEPRFLGRSLRLPLVAREDWTVLVMDLEEILTRHCQLQPARPGQSVLQAVKRVQLCSNMSVREVVTSNTDHYMGRRSLPKDLQVKSGADVVWNKLPRPARDDVAVPLPPPRDDTTETPVRGEGLPRRPLTSPGVAFLRSPANSIELQKGNLSPTGLMAQPSPPKVPLKDVLGPRLEDGDLALSAPPVPPPSQFLDHEPSEVDFGAKARGLPRVPVERTKRVRRGLYEPKHTPLPKNKAAATSGVGSNSRHQVSANEPATSSTSSVTRVGTPAASIAGSTARTPPAVGERMADRMMQLERLVGYQGGPAVLVRAGELLLFPSGSAVVVSDVYGKSSERNRQSKPGIWRNFRDLEEGSKAGNQFFLRAHTSAVTLMKLNAESRFLATAEEREAGPVVVWDLSQGRKAAVLHAHSYTTISAAFSYDGSLLATAGLDGQRRFQIIVWDLAMVLLGKGIKAGDLESAVVAKQISDFDITDMKFAPFNFDDMSNTGESSAELVPSLVTCGRENVRFWRIRKGHLPGRPVPLNEHSRGYAFTQVAFHAEPAERPTHPMRPIIFAASNHGLLFKIDARKEEVLCAYRLHEGPITALAVHGGYAVTGGEDARLRIWPLTFNDFLLEAHHESTVTNVHVEHDGRKVVVGTDSGTLGVLDVQGHGYKTVVRSHVGAVVSTSPRLPQCREFVTVGIDKTIRVWEVEGCTQKFEFTCPDDAPHVAVYHPISNTHHELAVGFESGMVRILDVPSTSTKREVKLHSAPVKAVLYDPAGYYLYSGSVDGVVTVSEPLNDYAPLRSVPVFAPLPTTTSPNIWLALNNEGTQLATAGTLISSVTVFSAPEMEAIMAGRGASPEADATASPGQGTGRPPFGSRRGTNSPGTPVSLSGSPRATTSPAIGSPLQAGATSSTACVTGLAFTTDRNGGGVLVGTSKYLISLPLSANGDGTWSERSVRKIDKGEGMGVTRMAKDPKSNMLLLAYAGEVSVGPNVSVRVGNPGSAGATVSTPLSHNQQLGAVFTSHKGGRSRAKLLTSPAQIYSGDTIGSLSSFAVLMETGRVVVVDTSGTISLWLLRQSNVEKLKTLTSSSPPNSTQLDASLSRLRRSAASDNAVSALGNSMTGMVLDVDGQRGPQSGSVRGTLTSLGRGLGRDLAAEAHSAPKPFVLERDRDDTSTISKSGTNTLAESTYAESDMGDTATTNAAAKRDEVARMGLTDWMSIKDRADRDAAILEEEREARMALLEPEEPTGGDRVAVLHTSVSVVASSLPLEPSTGHGGLVLPDRECVTVMWGADAQVGDARNRAVVLPPPYGATRTRPGYPSVVLQAALSPGSKASARLAVLSRGATDGAPYEVSLWELRHEHGHSGTGSKRRSSRRGSKMAPAHHAPIFKMAGKLRVPVDVAVSGEPLVAWTNGDALVLVCRLHEEELSELSSHELMERAAFQLTLLTVEDLKYVSDMCSDRFKDKSKNVLALVRDRTKCVTVAVSASAASAAAAVGDKPRGEGIRPLHQHTSFGLVVLPDPAIVARCSASDTGGPSVSNKFPQVVVAVHSDRVGAVFRIEPTRREGLAADLMWSDNVSSDPGTAFMRMCATLARRNSLRAGVASAPQDNVGCLATLDTQSVIRFAAVIPTDLLQPNPPPGNTRPRTGAVKVVSCQAKPKVGNSGGFGNVFSLAIAPPLASVPKGRPYDEVSGWACSVIIGGSSSIRVCSVQLSVTSQRGLLAIVHPAYKHSMSEPPRYLSPMLSPEGLRGTLLGFASGEISLLATGAERGDENTNTDERGHLMHVRQAVPAVPFACAVLSAPDGRKSPPILVSLTRGQLSLLHGVTGRSLPPPGNSGVAASAAHTCVSSTSRLLAIGYKNGRLAVYEAASLRLLKLVSCHKPLVTSTGAPIGSTRPKKRFSKRGSKSASIAPPAFTSVVMPEAKPYISIMRSSHTVAAETSLTASFDPDVPTPVSVGFVCSGSGLVCVFTDGSAWLVAMDVGGALAPAVQIVAPFVRPESSLDGDDQPLRRVRKFVGSCCTDGVTRYMSDDDRQIHLESYVPPAFDVWGLLYEDSTLEVYQTDVSQLTAAASSDLNEPAAALDLNACTTMRIRLSLEEEVETSDAGRAAALNMSHTKETEPDAAVVLPSEPANLIDVNLLHRIARNGSTVLSVCGVSAPKAEKPAVAENLVNSVRTEANPHSVLLQGSVELKKLMSAAERAAADEAARMPEAEACKKVWDDDSSVSTRQSVAAGINGLGTTDAPVGDTTTGLDLATKGTMNLEELVGGGGDAGVNGGVEDGDRMQHVSLGTDSTEHVLVLAQRMQLGVLSHVTFSAGLLATVGIEGVRVFDTCALGEKPQKDPNRPGYLKRRICVGAFTGYSMASHHSKYPSPVLGVPRMQVRGGMHDEDMQMHEDVCVPSLSRWDRSGPVVLAPDSEHSSDVSVFAHRPYPQSLLHLSCHFNEHMQYVLDSDGSDSGSSSSSDDDNKGARSFVKKNLARLYR